MTTINQLSAVDSLSLGDLMVIFSQENGDARKAALSVLVAFLQNNLATPGVLVTQYAAPSATGFSITIVPTADGASMFLLLTPSAGFAAGTILLPAVAVDGQEVLVTCTQAVTALTVSGNGHAINGAPTALTANGFFRMRYDAVLASWYRIG